MLIKPSLSSIWLAEDAVFDEQTGQTTLTSVFNQISLSAEGSEYDSPFSVMFTVSDVRRRCRCEMRLLDLADLSLVYRRPVILDEVSPWEVEDISLRVNRLPVFQPGAYVWELSLNEETLGSTRMTAVREL